MGHNPKSIVERGEERGQKSDVRSQKLEVGRWRKNRMNGMDLG